MVFMAKHSSEVLMRLDDIDEKIKDLRDAWSVVEHKFAELDRLVDESIDRREVRKRQEMIDRWKARASFAADKIKWLPKYMFASAITFGLYALFVV